MTDQGEHVITPQENALYEAMSAGDWDTVDQMRADAYGAEQVPDEETGLTPAQQFDVDYGYAYAHYQADHEAPEQAREAATKVEVHNENQDAAAAQEGV